MLGLRKIDPVALLSISPPLAASPEIAAIALFSAGAIRLLITLAAITDRNVIAMAALAISVLKAPL